MTYLFWAFAVVWIGLFLYIGVLVRRSRILEEQVRELGARAGSDAASPGGSREGTPSMAEPMSR